MPRRAVLIVVVALLAGCGGGETVSSTAERVEGAVPEENVVKGNPAAGKKVYTSAGCGACHVLQEAGTAGETGPNLDRSLEGRDTEYIRESIFNQDAEIAEGFEPGVMQKTYGEQLSDKQLADLVALLSKNA